MKKCKPDHVHNGMNRLNLDRILKQFGGDVITQRRTGEIVYTHPNMTRRVRGNGRRKDASRHQIRFVLAVIKQQMQAANDPVYDVTR